VSKKEDKDEKAEGGKKKGGMMMKLIIGLVLMAVGGGGVFGAMAAGVIPGMGHEEEEVDHSPQLVRKGEEDPYAVPGEGAEEGAAAYVPGEEGSEYRTVYYTFEEEFTSNLRDSPAMVQMSLAASTQRDGRVLMWMKEHELAIRSQLLIDLADTNEVEFMSPEGKERLQERMVASINRVLTEEEGFGGIDKVYFRSLIVQ
jgi:flagellar protein FliL